MPARTLRLVLRLVDLQIGLEESPHTMQGRSEPETQVLQAYTSTY